MDIIVELCVKYEVDKCELLSKRRGALVKKRRSIAKDLREMGYSYPAIGKLLNRHHTTIMSLLGAR